jgi:thioredoxin 2
MATTETKQATSTPRLTLRCTNCGKWNRVRADKAADGPKCGSCGTGLALDHPIKLDDETFDRVLAETEVPILVDFYADWCGPCKMMAPAVETLARESVGRALVAKLDTDHAQIIASRFQIRGIPTSIVFKKGREVKRQTGAVPLATLRGMLA